MNSKRKDNLGFVWSATWFFGLMIAASLILDQASNLPDHEPLLTASKNTSYQPFSDHTQYNLILDLQKAFIRNAKNVGPSVVNISKVYEVTKQNTWHDTPSDLRNSWFLNLKFWLNKKLREKYISETIGSGVIINESGYILTNHHVIENNDRILIRLSDKRDFFAKVVGVDPQTDLAVLKINSFRSLPHTSFSPSRDVEVGQWVMAIGNPYGLQGTVTVGVISGIRRSILGITTYEDFIQTDASINPGNSGGPLIDLDGKIIGINTSVAAVGSGIGFAIPSKMAFRIVEELIENGDVERGWLGVGIQGMTPELAKLFKMPSTQNGILINTVGDNTPAKDGGMMRGDVVIEYDEKQVLNSRRFQEMVADTEVGKKVLIEIIRDGLEQTILVTIGKHIS